MTEHQSFAEKCEKWGIRIWVIGIVILLLANILSGRFQLNAILTGCIPLLVLAFNRLVMARPISYPLSNDPTAKNNPAVAWYKMISVLARNMAAIGFLLVSFSPLLNALRS